MPAFYTKYSVQLKHYLGDFAHTLPAVAPFQPTVQDLVHFPATIGGRVLATNPGVNFQSLFNNFNNITAAFRWDPAASGSYSFDRVLEMLDGIRTSGECKIMAGALLGLWVFPPPFGLGQHRSVPKASLYTFENYDSNEGFISHHPTAGVRGLLPNIMHPFGTQQDLTTRQPLYQWGDHKTVYYANRLWDPSYGQIWNNETEMVAFQFTANPHPTDTQAYEVKVITANPTKGWMTNQIMFMRFDLMAGGWKGPYRSIS